MQNTSVITLYPNRLTITNKRAPLEFHKVKFNATCPSWHKYHKRQAVKNFSVVKNPFVISKASKKKILDSINSMYFLSEPREITMLTGKKIYNYRASFITLTLPSKQKHSDIDIKKECLNQFLTEIKKAYQINNYVWKAELQKNKNIHFHIVTDKYIDYQALRRRWNRIINKLGYVDEYRAKMRALSFAQYLDLNASHLDQDIKTAAQRFARGKKDDWKNPNSVDVKSVYSKKELAIYLSKYIAKTDKKTKKTASQLERELSFGRSWSRSYSLAQLKYKNKFSFDELKNVVKYLRQQKNKVLEIKNDFYIAFYFSAEKLHKAFRDFHKKIIFANASFYDYPIPVPT